MIKTLNGKLSLIYIVIILAMSLLGLVSVRNLITISNDIDGLLTNNYKSIQSVENMKDALYNQQQSLFLYISGDKEEALSEYSKNSSLFLDNFYFEKNNITEDGEMEYVNNLDTYYLQYSQNFFTLSEIVQNDGKESGYTFFLDEIKVNYDIIVKTLDNISSLNETMMINSKARVENKTKIIIN